MSLTRHGRAVLATITVLTLIFLPLSAYATPKAALSGTIFDEGQSPREGIVITLVNADTQAEFSSSPTTEQGRFVLEGAPAGRYMVFARAEEGNYLAATDFNWQAAQDAEIILALAPAVQDDDDDADGTAPPATQGRAQGMPTWGKAVLVGVLTITGIALIDEVSEDSDEAASAF